MSCLSPHRSPNQEDPDFFDDKHHEVGSEESTSASSTPFTPADATGETSWQLTAPQAAEDEEEKSPTLAAAVSSHRGKQSK